MIDTVYPGVAAPGFFAYCPAICRYNGFYSCRNRKLKCTLASIALVLHNRT